MTTIPISSKKLKVLIVDDMLTYRTILTRVLSRLEYVEVSGTAANGRLALEEMEKKPADLVLIDLEMPVMNGLETVPELRRRFPDAQVVLISGTTRNSADLTMQALEAGAMDFIPKPAQDSLNANMEELFQKLQSITMTCRESKAHTRPRALVHPTQPIRQPEAHAIDKPRAPFTKPFTTGGIDVIIIGVSTGGPNALAELIPALPAKLGVPILIVQHMPPIFTASLANTLNKKSTLHVKEAEDQEAILSDTVYIAPGGRHMSISPGSSKQPVITLTDGAPVNSCRPAVDVLFRSIPAIYGKKVLSLIMTGMGNDGMAGVRELKILGCHSITQSADSCVVYGMPRAVDEHNLSDEQVALSGLANRITELIRVNG